MTALTPEELARIKAIARAEEEARLEAQDEARRRKGGGFWRAVGQWMERNMPL